MTSCVSTTFTAVPESPDIHKQGRNLDMRLTVARSMIQDKSVIYLRHVAGCLELFWIKNAG